MGLFNLFKKKPDTKEPQKFSLSDANKITAEMETMSRKSAYKLTLDRERTPSLTDTKFGGVPYWDSRCEYPVSSKGEKLFLLAQINLSDVKDCEKLPSSGLLQFFIGANDLYGMDFENYISNDSFRVVYHENLDESITKDDVLSLGIPTNLNGEDDDFLFPVAGELAVNVATTEVSIGTEDFEYERYMNKAASELKIKHPDETPFSLFPEEVFDRECEAQRNSGHWLFGYAYFTQNDPRDYMVDLQDYILLFQMDSDYAGDSKHEVLWGDCGVGNFFIKPDDLEKLDFSKVMYNWDCC